MPDNSPALVVVAAGGLGTRVHPWSQFIPQHGPYGDITSVLNGADSLAAEGGLYVVFADNLYLGTAPLLQLCDSCPGDVTVLASKYRRALASSCGILITRPGPEGTLRRVLALAEKPGPADAIALEGAHGTANLLMLEGRARLTSKFIQFARARQATGPGSEPKLAPQTPPRQATTRGIIHSVPVS